MKEAIEKVYGKISSFLNRTRLASGTSLDKILGNKLLLKMENEQITGSFKLRGVLSKFEAITRSIPTLTRVVAASTGNHALAVCHASKAHHCLPVIFVPETISKSKLAKLETTNAKIYQEGAQSGETEQIAIEWAKKHDLPLIHPYNDPAVIAGQGTIGLELIQQAPHQNQVFVPVGGGGLISGIAGYLKQADPSIRIVGVQPENACEMADSIQKKFIVPPSKLSTISDGTAGGLDPGTITYQYCIDLVDEFILVQEQEIINALRLLDQHLGIRVEPAAALALAGIIKSSETQKQQVLTAIVCGGNIDEKSYSGLLSTFS